MVTPCAAYGYTNRIKEDVNISFHRFPHSKPELLQKWVQAIRRKGWSPNKNSFICSVQFTDSCFAVIPGKLGHRRNKDAIPSLFFSEFPRHLQKTESKMKSPVKRKSIEPKASVCQPSPSKVTWLIDTKHTYVSNKTCDVKVKKLTKQLCAL